MPCRVVQPWGKDRGHEAALISDHASALEAFAAIDAISARMVKHGVPSDAIELVVVDDDGEPARRRLRLDPARPLRVKTAIEMEVDRPTIS